MITLMIIEEFIKMFTLHLCILLLFYKITATKEKNFILMSISIIGITVINVFLEYCNFNFANRLIITGLIYSIILGIITKKLIHYSLIATIISYSITFMVNTIGIMIMYFLVGKMLNEINGIVHIIILELLTIVIVCIILKIKRLDNGLSFLNNNNKLEILNVTIFILSTEIILYTSILKKPVEELRASDAFSFFIMTSLFMGMLVFMNFRAYYKSIQTEKLIHNQGEEIKSKDEKYEKLYIEHERVTKKLHETSHKVKAMAGYLTEVYSMNEEFGEDSGDLLAEIKELQQELSINSATNDLVKTDVLSIDVMLSYMQNEALKSNIELELIVNGDINDMISNVVDKKALEKMIADHIQDSIIAIKASEEDSNRKILVKLGKFKEYYILDVKDTGIDFDINTLVNLGLKRVTTHSDAKGTGIGFMTTFENLQICKGSLEIQELNVIEDNIYSKSVRIVFDSKNEYRMFSSRADTIKIADENNRIIFN